MTFTESISTCFRKYSDFEGRATRSEYWWFIIFVYGCISLPLFGLSSYLISHDIQTGGIFVVILVVFLFAVLFPLISVGVRRLHDTGRSGFYLLSALIPYIGHLYLIFLLIQDSDYNNEYGESQYGDLFDNDDNE